MTIGSEVMIGPVWFLKSNPVDLHLSNLTMELCVIARGKKVCITLLPRRCCPC